MKLVKLPQSGTIFDIDEIVLIGQVNSKAPLYVVVLRNAAQGPQISQGDYNSLVKYLATCITELEPVREEAKAVVAA